MLWVGGQWLTALQGTVAAIRQQLPACVARTVMLAMAIIVAHMGTAAIALFARLL
jgi:hypothetical protein